MNAQGKLARALIVAIGLCVLCSSTTVSSAAENSRYISTTIRGVLTEPKDDSPMASAIVRFSAVHDPSAVMEAVTGENGAFTLGGLTFGRYNVEIETLEGEKISAINSVRINDKKSVIIFKFSDRLRSDTVVDNEADRIMIVVNTRRTKWKKFWGQFAIFMGIAGAGSTID